MSASRVIAPFAVCAVVAAAAPALGPVDSPIFSPAATLTSAFHPASLATAETGTDLASPSTVVAGGSFIFDIVDILSIMSALAANNPTFAATMQTVTTTLLTELAQGKPLGEAMVDVSLQLAGSINGDLGTTIQTALTQIGRMWALAPAVISGAITVVAEIPKAVAPVVTAVATAVVNVLAAVGSDGLTAAVTTGLNDVLTAAAKGLAAMVDVVQKVVHDIAAVLNGGSGSAAAARGSKKDGLPAEPTSTKTTNNAPQTKKGAHSATSARAAAGARPKRSASAPAVAEKSSTGSRSAGSARAAGNRDADPASGTAGAKSAR